MFQELTKEISALAKDQTLFKNSDVMKDISDAFSGSSSVKLT